jgi:hypothetical protein
MSFTTTDVMRLEAKNPVPVPVPPVVKGEPGIEVSDPSAATDNPDTLFGPAISLFVYTKVPCAIKQMAQSTSRKDNHMVFIIVALFLLARISSLHASDLFS